MNLRESGGRGVENRAYKRMHICDSRWGGGKGGEESMDDGEKDGGGAEVSHLRAKSTACARLGYPLIQLSY